MSEVSLRRDRTLVNSHTDRNESSESLAEAGLAYFIPNMDSVEVALALSHITYILSIMIDDFRSNQGRKFPSCSGYPEVNGTFQSESDKYITAVMFHPRTSTRINARN